MSLSELWQLFPIIISKPNLDWADWARLEMEDLHKRLGPIALKIHHIGSTAIHSIMAKPIIDLLVETTDASDFEGLKRKIIAAGYLCMNQTPTRIDFNKGYTPAGFAEKVFHLHLRLNGDHDEIYFRDYLNAHPDVAKEYEALKLSLWKRFEHDRDGYTNAKSDFVKHYTSLAKQSN